MRKVYSAIDLVSQYLLLNLLLVWAKTNAPPEFFMYVVAIKI